ncbi:flagellar protein FlgN [Pseudoxanthomonas sp. PXM02]|jgi:flagellar biosynthesis/type III secretory pathway chaperone|uniref:flagellar protein FlgN n=1 Tax=Pseudoxanthomonas sp. PXM02 TaxID=2769294 RepID=UPI00177D1F54|nr:flagellar protein FlgN [Pseudoxanthomonas sp. PXM02]MBD9481056.1 flagellar protein FlgN [Pseudoxanthomonas sp. PXM02]
MTQAPLQRLSAALDEERRAIVEHDVEALVRSTQEKLDALRALEAAAAGFGFSEDMQARLAELAELNHANGILLARRRREVNWALRHLGRTESHGAYDAQGQTSTTSAPRPLAVA